MSRACIICGRQGIRGIKYCKRHRNYNCDYELHIKKKADAA